MKKFFICFVMAFVSIIASAQVSRDFKMSDNTHVIEGSCFLMNNGFTDTQKLFASIEIHINKTDTCYYLNTNVNTLKPLGVYKGAPCLLKTTNGDIIELSSCSVASSSKEFTFGTYNVTTVVNKTKNGYIATTNVNKPTNIDVQRNIYMFPISKEDVMKLKDGVVKMKIGFNTDNYEKEFKKKSFGSLYKSYLSIVERLNNPKNSNFKDSF